MAESNSEPFFRRAQERRRPLGILSKLLYAWGEMPGSHMNFAIGGFLLLYYNQELPSKEVARILGLEDHQVRSRLSYARKKLRALMGSQ